MESKCSVCCDIFDVPRFLNCAHTFCESCLQECIDQNAKGGQIECPLCRAKTSYLRNGAKGFFQNFFVSQRQKHQQIVSCEDCATVQLVKICGHCDKHLCVNCMASHEVVQKIKKNDRYSTDEPFDNPSSPPPPPSFNTSYQVVQMHSFQVSYEDSTRRHQGQLCIKSIISTNGEECIVCPNGENVLITFDIRSGLELERKYIEIEVVEMVMGINGHPLIIGNHTSVIFECRPDGVHPTANTGMYVPFTLAALNNDRFVVCSVTRIHELALGTNVSSGEQYGVLQIFGMRGEIYIEVSEVNGEHKLQEPRDVTVNLTTNDIYVADHSNMSLQLYQEDGTLVKSFDGTQCRFINNFGIIAVPLIFPFTCCFDAINQLVLASDTTGTIRVFSPSLELIGIVISSDHFGLPTCLLCNPKGKIFIGDHRCGSVKVFTINEFSNRLNDR